VWGSPEDGHGLLGNNQAFFLFISKSSKGGRMKKAIVVVSMLVFGALSTYALPPAAAGYGLAWSDEFNGTTLDTSAWTSDTGLVYNAEQEKYVDSCIEVSNGRLKVWSKSKIFVANTSAPVHGNVYPSGRIDTHDKKIFKYGYFEAAIQGPIGTGGKNGPGLWSAVWLLGNSIHHGVGWPTCGEMELYEQRTCACNVAANAAQPVPAIAGDNEFIACCHYGVNGNPDYHSCQHNYTKCLCDGFHKYAVLWDSTHVEYYFDDSLFWGPNFPTAQFTTPSINLGANFVAFHSPFYWIVNVAVGGAYQGQNIDQSIFPTHMDLDYVRVYQKGVGVINSEIKRDQTLRAFTLVNPSTAQLKVYDLSGRLVADYSSKVRQMKIGDNVMNMMPSVLRGGAYVVKLTDNGVSTARKFVASR
jgi:beta-glucanase (GH16 family)